MANKFGASIESKGCPIMVGKEKISIEEIIEKYPIISVTGVGTITVIRDGKEKSVPVISFRENENVYFFGGKAWEEIIMKWTKTYSLTLEEISGELNEEPCQVKMEIISLKGGKKYTKVTAI